MLLNGRRIQNLHPQTPMERGGEWLYFHNTAQYGSFSRLGNGMATWILDVLFQVQQAGWYQMTIAVAPHAQANPHESLLPGSAYAEQGGRRTEDRPRAINNGDILAVYLDPGLARLRIQLPIMGDGLGGPIGAEPNLIPHPNGAPQTGEIRLLELRIVQAPVSGPVPGPAPTGAPNLPTTTPAAS